MAGVVVVPRLRLRVKRTSFNVEQYLVSTEPQNKGSGVENAEITRTRSVSEVSDVSSLTLRVGVFGPFNAVLH
jgi:hypothetical protein